MRHLIPFYLIAIFCSSLVFCSCTKTDAGAANTRQDILMRHKWKHYQTRVISIDTITNTVIKDTMEMAEICYQNSFYIFLAGGVVKRTLECFPPPQENSGTWYIMADSSFSASIPIRLGYGTGAVYGEFGIPNCKMKVLTETDLQLFGVSYNFFYSIKYYYTLYLKAVD
jgi:hypothetical protein